MALQVGFRTQPRPADPTQVATWPRLTVGPFIHEHAAVLRSSCTSTLTFTAVQVLWTLTFAAHLVLLVVLLGRDRIRRFPWFTTAIVLVTLRLLISRLLYGRLPQLTMSAIFVVLADLSSIVGLLVVLELARRAFGRAPRRSWIIATVVLLAMGGCVLAFWGKWPAWKTLAVDNPMAVLGLMQLVAQKAGLLVDVLTIQLGLIVLLFGRRYGAGWRSHAQQIVIGLSTASIAQVAIAGHLANHRQDRRTPLHGGVPARRRPAGKAV